MVLYFYYVNIIFVLAGMVVFSIINLIIYYYLMPIIMKRKTLALAHTRDGDGTSNRSLYDGLNEFSANFPGLFTVEPYPTEGRILGRYQILSN